MLSLRIVFLRIASPSWFERNNCYLRLNLKLVCKKGEKKRVNLFQTNGLTSSRCFERVFSPVKMTWRGGKMRIERREREEGRFDGCVLPKRGASTKWPVYGSRVGSVLSSSFSLFSLTLINFQTEHLLFFSHFFRFFTLSHVS